MTVRPRIAVVLLLGITLVLALLPWPDTEAFVEGSVDGERGPLAGAHVRWQGSTSFTVSGADGRFRLPVRYVPGGHITASKPGYRIAAVNGQARPANVFLTRLPTADNEDYTWLSPHPDAGQVRQCGNCHEAIYRDWSLSGHARSARNAKLLQLFSDPDGKSPAGWDLSRAHPLGRGVCATCHAPTFDEVRADDDLRQADGVAADGVHCDYCHKVVGAPTDKVGLRFGRDGLNLLRPANGDLLSYGPLEDAVRAGESFAALPLYRESQICASCHEGTVFGVHVYGTYSEWLNSPARKQGIQCQGCHMAPTGVTNLAAGKGGIERPAGQLAGHRFPGSDPEMLRRSLDAKVCCQRDDGKLRVDLVVSANHVGHRVPTGFIDRHLLLVVEAFDQNGASLPASAGPLLPSAAGDHAGRAGVLYGKLLCDDAGHGPLPFWLPGLEIHDSRLYPGAPDRQTFRFPAHAARIEVRLWYRRFWHAVAAPRGWADNDLLVLKRVVEP